MDKPWLDPTVSALATKVMGWTWDPDEGAWSSDTGYVIAGWNPPESIEHAFQVVAKLSSDGLPLEMKEQDDCNWEPVYLVRFGICYGAIHREPAKAITRAAIEACKEYYD